MSRILTMSLILLVTIAVTGCGGKQAMDARVIDHAEFDGAPNWVIIGHDGNTSTISAVGSANGTRNVSLARSTATGRARTELARQLNTEVTAMIEDYQATTTGGAEFGSKAADDQHVEDVARQITEINLSGTRARDVWVSGTGTMYVLVSLDVETFSEAISQMGSLSQEIRAAVQSRARAAFDRLDQQTAGR